MKTTKRILAFMTALVLCFAPTMLMVAASDNGPCGHSLDDYSIDYGDVCNEVVVGTADHCYSLMYPNATETCNTCGYTINWTYEIRYTYHSYVNSPDCVYCGYRHPDYQ